MLSLVKLNIKTIIDLLRSSTLYSFFYIIRSPPNYVALNNPSDYNLLLLHFDQYTFKRSRKSGSCSGRIVGI